MSFNGVQTSVKTRLKQSGISSNDHGSKRIKTRIADFDTVLTRSRDRLSPEPIRSVGTHRDFSPRQTLSRGKWQPLATCDTWSSCCSIAAAHVLSYASTRARTTASLDARFQCDRLRYFCVDSVERSLARSLARATALKVDSSLAREFRPRRVPSHSGDQHNTWTTYAFCQAAPTSTRPIYITRGFAQVCPISTIFFPTPTRVIRRGCCFFRVADICRGARLKYAPGTCNVLVTRNGTSVFSTRLRNRTVSDRMFRAVLQWHRHWLGRCIVRSKFRVRKRVCVLA